MKRRDSYQRSAYAARRASLAVNRVILGRNPERARLWAIAWAARAGWKSGTDHFWVDA